MRLIDADAFDERVRAAGGMSEEELSEDFKDGVLAVLYMMSKQPTITAQPERQKGEWMTDELSGLIYCSRCGNVAPMETTGGRQYKSNFCQTCGVDMRGERDDERTSTNSVDVEEALNMAINALTAQPEERTEMHACDWVSRQAVQEIVDRIGGMYPYRQIGNRDSYSQYNEAWTDAINRVGAELNSLPSAQSTMGQVFDDDCVSRQAAIDAMKDVLLDEELDYAIPTLERLPSAQPDLSSYSDKLWRNAYERGRKEAMEEIIRCKDCKWGDWYTSVDRKRYCYCMETGNGGRTEDDFCSYAERRTDGGRD